jgi:predicted O-methyltransferase YrrM
MFDNIPEEILKQMHRLEKADAADRLNGTPRIRRLRQIPPETGKFLALMAACAPPGVYIEIGTSAGYSSLYIILACRLIGAKLVTFEILAEKARLAEATFRQAGIADEVELVNGDAREFLEQYRDIAFCFLDAEKDVYRECYDLVIPSLKSGGLLLADNVLSHPAELGPFVDFVSADGRVDVMVVPIGRGVLLCRRI